MKFSQTLRKLSRETRGAEIAEAAAVLPIMFMVLLGIFWFGQAFSIYGAITRAAQEGARAGAVPACATCSGSSSNTLITYATNAVTATQNALTASNLDPTLASQPTNPPAFAACNTSTVVNVSCPNGLSNNFCVQIPVVLTTATEGGTGDCGISMSFRYPYKFWLPFTSVNNQTIYMNASARVRLEMH